MNIPFRLNIFKQIEIYQELKELEKQFKKQLKDLYEHKVLKTIYAKNSPVWFFVKKILYWAYINHKHLGSPIKIMKYTDTWYTDLDCTAEEFEDVQIRKVLGWMEVNGLAKFFKKEENNYWNINQENCEGIFLTPKGLEYARMIYSLYEFKDAKGEYKKIRGVKNVLKIIKDQKLKFDLYIYIGWFIMLGSVLLFSKTLYVGNLFCFTIIVLILLSFLKCKKYKSFKFYLK